MSIENLGDSFAEFEALAAARKEAASTRAELDQLKKAFARADAELDRALVERNSALERVRLIESLDQFEVERQPRWLKPEAPRAGHKAILTLLLTDTHFDEVVDPAQIHGINAYNRQIAEIRLETFFASAVKLARHYLAGVEYEGVCLLLGGDIFSGNIHEELQRTNEDTLFASLEYWLDPMEAGLRLLADEFGSVHVAGTPGNHGRLTRKPIAKSRAADNLDWLFYRLLVRDMRNDSRFSWNIPTSADTEVQVYGTRYLLTHGDQFRGGSGISGAVAPLMLGQHRKNKRQSSIGKPYDYMVIGHWHQTWAHHGLILGGAIKGYDEYAFLSNFDPEPPQQSGWITTPERGITFSFPIQCMDREREGW